MKTFSLCAVILLVGVLSSCEKDSSEELLQSQNFAKQTGYRTIWCVTSWIGPPVDMSVTDCGCSGSNGNCLPDVDVSASRAVILSDFIDAVNNKETDMFFIGNTYKELFGNISNFHSYIDGLRNGSLVFSILPDAEDKITFAALHMRLTNVTPANARTSTIIVVPFLKE